MQPALLEAEQVLTPGLMMPLAPMTERDKTCEEFQSLARMMQQTEVTC